MFVHGLERFLKERCQTSRAEQRVVYTSSFLPEPLRRLGVLLESLDVVRDRVSRDI